MKKTKKTKKAYEQYLNELYSDQFSKDHAVRLFVYLTNKKRIGTTTTLRCIKDAHGNQTLGTLLRKHDSSAFDTGFNDWNP